MAFGVPLQLPFSNNATAFGRNEVKVKTGVFVAGAVAVGNSAFAPSAKAVTKTSRVAFDSRSSQRTSRNVLESGCQPSAPVKFDVRRCVDWSVFFSSVRAV